MSFTDTALQLLKSRGYRVTKPRRLVLELLDTTDAALSAYEIKDRLDAANASVDTASIYRILECLEENQLVHRVLSSGKVRKCQLEHEEDCHREQPDHCHHLLICRRCNTIEELHCLGLNQLVANIETQSQFQVESHNLEFFGVCRRCQG